jgi:hypothetical protein
LTQNRKAALFNFGDLDGYSNDSDQPEPIRNRQGNAERSELSLTRPRVGAEFIPYKKFICVLIPEAMARNRDLPPGAKLVYGRLSRYSGKDGRCYPALETLAEEVGLGKRQTQKHLRTLESEGFIRRVERFADRRQTSNRYVFLWHQLFEDWEKEQLRKG